MNVLLCGAGNSISIALARYLRENGHTPILADATRHARGFYSKYCRTKYLLRDPASDRQGFASDLFKCIRQEDVGLVVPTSDRALLSLVDAGGSVLRDVAVTFPNNRVLIRSVMDKSNIPSLCRQAGIASLPTYPIASGFQISDLERTAPPYVLKISRGISGEGFRRLASLREAERAVQSLKNKGIEGDYLIQQYREGAVYGAAAVFENNDLMSCHTYRYLRRYPHPAGNPTVCIADRQESIRDAMRKILKSLQWKGFCQMDFILPEESMVPYLIDINPVHWYSVPNSFVKEFNSLRFYLEGGRTDLSEGTAAAGNYTTIGLLRELQRLLLAWKQRSKDFPQAHNYMKSLRYIKACDFYWDPLPVIVAPVLRLLRGH